MGSCISSPQDGIVVQTSLKSVQNGSDESALIFNGNMNTSSRITLSFECTNLPRMDIASKSDPFIVVYTQDNLKNWYEIGRTEVIVNTQTPKFVQKICMQYKFEEIQKLRFVVYDADTEGLSTQLDLSKQDLIGEVCCDLPMLVHSISSKQFPIMLNNKNRGELVVKCEELHQSSGNFCMRFTSDDLPSQTFIEISNEDEKNGITPVFKTEVSKNGIWKNISIDISILCNCDINRPLIFKAFRHKNSGNHVVLGEYKSTAASLFQMAGQTVTLTGKTPATMKIHECYFEEKASFLQFVQNGLDINFMVAIDFTGSNGNPVLMNSLHYNNPGLFAQGKFNQYERAIAMIGNVIEFYDTDRKFPVYGFGACPANTSAVNHCFALNNNEFDPEVPGVSGIMDIYHRMMPTLRFSGPTFFAPVLSKAATIASMIQQERSKYLILLIITDGEIHDMEATIKLLVDCSDLPLSVLIVGVGDADFTNMEILDGDDNRLKYQGKTCSRDIVQFVAMRELATQPPEVIAQQLLEEVPMQVTEYMKSKGITPSTLHCYVCFYKLIVVLYL